jgi:hypothetical protein
MNGQRQLHLPPQCVVTALLQAMLLLLLPLAAMSHHKVAVPTATSDLSGSIILG